MKTAHASMGLKDVDFNALAEDLQLSMDKEKVSPSRPGAGCWPNWPRCSTRSSQVT